MKKTFNEGPLPPGPASPPPQLCHTETHMMTQCKCFNQADCQSLTSALSQFLPVWKYSLRIHPHEPRSDAGPAAESVQLPGPVSCDPMRLPYPGRMPIVVAILSRSLPGRKPELRMHPLQRR